jgi:hypothetical protein
VDGQEERRRDRSGRLFLHHRDALAARGCLERVDEPTDLLRVVADIRDEGDIGAGQRHERRGDGRPATFDHADIPDPVLANTVVQCRDHRRGRVDGDDLAGRERERERISTGARTDVQPGV